MRLFLWGCHTRAPVRGRKDNSWRHGRMPHARKNSAHGEWKNEPWLSADSTNANASAASTRKEMSAERSAMRLSERAAGEFWAQESHVGGILQRRDVHGVAHRYECVALRWRCRARDAIRVTFTMSYGEKNTRGFLPFSFLFSTRNETCHARNILSEVRRWASVRA